MSPSQPATVASRLPIALTAAFAAFALHLIGNPHYGFFRDELYFIICGRHLEWGNVDQPPIAPLLAAASQVFGHSLLLLRAVPAFFAAAGIYVTCLLAAELGAAAFGQILAAIVVFFTPVLMDFGMKVSPDMVGLWLWPLLALLILRLTKGADSRLWLVVGALAGICLQSKYSVLFFLTALLAGLLLTPERRIFWSRWVLAGCLIGGLIALPNVLWQVHHGNPTLEFLRNGAHGKNVMLGPLQYILQQLLITGFLFPVWIIGLLWLISRTRVRFLGYSFAILIALMIVFHGKSYYPANAYPILIAAGGFAIENWTRRSRSGRVIVLAAVVILGAMTAPIVMPILPEAQLASYQTWLFGAMHLSREATATEHHAQSTLPSDAADMHGWPELTATVARVYDSLPPAERARAGIYAGNYGEAGAIDFFGPDYGLPGAISGHNQYYLWGTRGYSGEVLIVVDGNCVSASKLFQSCVVAARFSAPWIQPYEDGAPILVCRGIKKPLAEVWPSVKSYR
jgi:hypothetical protein